MNNGLIIGSFGLLNVLLTSMLLIGRWSQKVESPVTLALLSRDIQDLTKEINGLREVFDRRYTGLEGRYNTDHERLRQLLMEKPLVELKLSEIRRDIDEVRVHCGLMHGRREGDERTPGSTP